MNIEGNAQGLMVLELIVFFTLLWQALLFLTIWQHVRKNKTARKMTALDPVYDDLVKSVRFGRTTDEEIKKAVLPGDFPYFRRYLQKSIGSVEDIDVSAERRIADVSGFTDHLKKRIASERKWDKTLAVRVLSSLRDARHVPLFRELLRTEKFVQTVYAAGLGLALCKDTASVFDVGSRLWQISKKNHDALLLILYVYGKEIAPIALRALEDDAIFDDAKPVVLDFLSENPCADAAGTLKKLLQQEPPEAILEPLLNAVRRLGSKDNLAAVLPFLSHKNFTVRIEAVLAVADLGGADVLPHMEKCMRDENWWVRREAAKGIARMGHPGLLLLRLKADGNEENPRSAARTVLAELQFNRIAQGGL